MGMTVKWDGNEGGGEFTPAPKGTHQAVLADVVDLGMVTSTFGGKAVEKHRVRLVWQLSKKMENGLPYVAAKRYTFSLHPKSSLFKDLSAWIGLDEAGAKAGLDLEDLIGTNALLTITHRPRKEGDGVWSEVGSVGPLMDGMVPIKVSADYRRKKDRSEPFDASFPKWNDEDLPF